MTKSWNDLADLQEPDYSAYNNLLIIDANNLSYRWLQRPNYASFDQTLSVQFNLSLNHTKLLVQ